MAGRVKKCPNFIKNGQKLPSQAAFAQHLFLQVYDLFKRKPFARRGLLMA
jgi:hypothetical protein